MKPELTAANSSGNGPIDCFHDGLKVLPDGWPVVGKQYDQCKASCRHVLLVAQILVPGNHHIETCLFGRLDEEAIHKLVPPHLAREPDLVGD